MLNNEFRLIGTVVSEFEKGGTESFPKTFLTIEVEKKNKTTPATFKTVVYGKNFSIDTTKSVKGKQVVATGYLDEYKGSFQLVLQDMIIVGELPKEEKVADVALAEIDLPDDDLPF